MVVWKRSGTNSWTYPGPIEPPKRAIFDHRSLYNSIFLGRFTAHRTKEASCKIDQPRLACRARSPPLNPHRRGQPHCDPFTGSLDLKLAFPGSDELPGVGEHLRDFGVVVVGVVMEEEELFHFRLEG